MCQRGLSYSRGTYIAGVLIAGSIMMGRNEEGRDGGRKTEIVWESVQDDREG